MIAYLLIATLAQSWGSGDSFINHNPLRLIDGIWWRPMDITPTSPKWMRKNRRIATPLLNMLSFLPIVFRKGLKKVKGRSYLGCSGTRILTNTGLLSAKLIPVQSIPSFVYSTCSHMKICLLQNKTVLIRLANRIIVEALLSGGTANGLLRGGVFQTHSPLIIHGA